MQQAYVDTDSGQGIIYIIVYMITITITITMTDHGSRITRGWQRSQNPAVDSRVHLDIHSDYESSIERASIWNSVRVQKKPNRDQTLYRQNQTLGIRQNRQGSGFCLILFREIPSPTQEGRFFSLTKATKRKYAAPSNKLIATGALSNFVWKAFREIQKRCLILLSEKKLPHIICVIDD